jgi:hypothetical protein
VQRRLRIQRAVVRSTGGASAEAPEDTARRGAKHRRCKCIRRLRIQRAVVPSLKAAKKVLVKLA